LDSFAEPSGVESEAKPSPPPARPEPLSGEARVAQLLESEPGLVTRRGQLNAPYRPKGKGNEDPDEEEAVAEDGNQKKPEPKPKSNGASPSPPSQGPKRRPSQRPKLPRKPSQRPKLPRNPSQSPTKGALQTRQPRHPRRSLRKRTQMHRRTRRRSGLERGMLRHGPGGTLPQIPICFTGTTP
jgi:hypothetical protein